MAPGFHEDVIGRPFVHKSGILLQEEVLDRLGYRRDQFYIDNAIKCFPPKDNLEQIASWMAGKREPTMLHPLVACSPLLERDLTGREYVMALGADAAQALSGSRKEITKYAGSSDTGQWGHKLFYNYHPAYVLRVPNSTEVFRDLFKKGMDWFTGALRPVKIKARVVRNLEQLRQATDFLAGRDWISWDIETNLDVGRRHIRCIGFGWLDVENLVGCAFVVPYRDLKGRPQEAVRDKRLGLAVVQWLAAQAGRLTGHNSGQFDRRVVLDELGVDVATEEDSILLHLLVGNALPRNLGFLGSWLTPQLDAWKADHTATQARSYEELLRYNCKDVVYQPLVRMRLREQLSQRGSGDLLEKERALQWFGMQMQRVGMRVDIEATRGEEKKWKIQKRKALIDLRMILPGINPGSHKQLHNLFYSKWKLPIVKLSEKTGQSSIDDETLRMWVASDLLDETQYRAVMKLREYRRADKIMGTYLTPILNGALLDKRGYLVPSYNRLPASGRYSSSDPNAQNWPWYLRHLIIPPDGMVFVSADQSAVEARIIAEESGDARIIGIFLDGADIHNESLEWVYGSGVWALGGAPADRGKKGAKSSDFSLSRDRVKNVRYAFQYGAGLKTIRQQVGRVELVVNGRLTFPFAAMDPEEILHVVQRLKEMSPELVNWWDAQEAFYARHGYIQENIWGRRRYYSHGAKLNDLANHPIQGAGASLIHEAMFDLFGQTELITGTVRERPEFRFKPLKFHPERGAGLLTQTHDSLVLCVPEEEGPEWAAVLSEVMCRRTLHRGLLPYTGEATMGYQWE
jgi:uracil-DNA glycosylase family 4